MRGSNIKTIYIAMAWSVAVWLSACSSPEKKEGPAKADQEPVSAEKDEDGPEKASANRVTLTNSLANNPLTSQTIPPSKAEAEIAKFKAAKGELALQGVISTQRLARKNLGEVISTAKKLADTQMEKGAGRQLGGEVKLEIALAALQSRNFAFAEYLLQDLTDSKNVHVKAGAYNAMGVVALKDDRVPEAVLYFKEALKAVPSYKPALMNLGFVALKGGELGMAKQLLGKIENDWFVSYGLISLQRLDGDVGGALEQCDKVLKKQPEHSAALFNCGLVEYQNKKNLAKAKEYFNKAGKAKLTAEGWNEKAFLMVAQIDAEEAQAKREEMQAKAAKASADKAAADKAAAEKAARERAAQDKAPQDKAPQDKAKGAPASAAGDKPKANPPKAEEGEDGPDEGESDSGEK